MRFQKSKKVLKKWPSRIVLLICSTVLTLIIGEVAVRLCGHLDDNGNFFVRSLRCHPYRLPVNTSQAHIARYLSSISSAVVWDPHLGWAHRPGSKSENGWYSYNADAIRTASSETVVSKKHQHGLLRIEIFGDSFTHGNDVPFHNTWGYYLERDLKASGIPAEVLNFGMGGYGMDQAFLRWETEGYLYQPHIVLFGLRLENILRNVNLIRSLYLNDTGLPFTKPRFVLEQERLTLINAPPPPPDRLLDIMNDVSSWELSRYEYWYNKEDYRERWFLRSELASFAYSWFKSHRPHRTAHDENLEKLSLRIIQSFKESVEAHGGVFYVVYLPLKENVRLLERNMVLRPRFLKNLEEVSPIIHTETQLLAEAEAVGIDATIPLHYSPKANEIVGAVVTKFLVQKIEQEQSGRF